MMRSVVFYILISGLLLAASCKPKHNDVIVPGGGKGGNATIIARVAHVTLVDTAIIYIKYGATNAPSDGVYDDSARVAANHQVIFSGLTTGNYYFFGEGIHYPYVPPTVEGGRGWTIQHSSDIDTVTINTTTQDFTYPSWAL